MRTCLRGKLLSTKRKERKGTMKRQIDDFQNDPDNLLDLSFDRGEELSEYQQEVRQATARYFNQRFAVENDIEKEEEFDFFNPPTEMRVI